MARETKHTPGPWVMQIPQESNGYVNIQMGDKFASVYGDVVDNIGHPSEESVATARLIAASPEMYEALKGLLSWSAHLPFAADDKVEFARDVIKKIEG